ncbi:MAG: hypothetical protein CUN52_03675 [Phototrophicales bacterium]|nr:MAG: hypothetical protein CUN52_03675 [Phototrophicales bacterium]
MPMVTYPDSLTIHHRFSIININQFASSSHPEADQFLLPSNIIEPIFDARFIPHSYANRIGRGTHRAIDQFQLIITRCSKHLAIAIKHTKGAIGGALTPQNQARLAPSVGF